MFDYTQHAFAAPPDIFDPTPSVADYLDDYTARNAAWYDAWAYPQGPGQWGSRPSSFERRGPYIPPVPGATEIPTDVLPPVLRDLYGGGEDNRISPEDRPVGALVRDVRDMTTPELAAETEALRGLWGHAGEVVSTLLPGPPLVGGLLSREGVEERLADTIGERMFRAPQPSSVPDLFFASDAVAPSQESRQQDVIAQALADLERGYQEAAGYTPERESRGTGDTGRDTYQGGEVGAGGWAGSGGL